MKKKKVLKIFIILLCIAVLAGVVLFFQEQKRKRQEWIEQEILKIEYYEQNTALPLGRGYSASVESYVGYEAVDEEELYVRLAAYNEQMRLNGEEEKELTLVDVEEYLSNEYNEDGSLRIYKGYEKIRRYMDWYFEEEGDLDIAAYWRKLEDIVLEYQRQNSNIIFENSKEMDLAQLQELINKKNDPTYEINMEVMKE